MLHENVVRHLQMGGSKAPDSLDTAGDELVADLLGVGRDIAVTKTFTAPCTELAVMLNCSALCPSREIQAILSGAVEALCELYNLNYLVFKEECFGMR